MGGGFTGEMLTGDKLRKKSPKLKGSVPPKKSQGESLNPVGRTAFPRCTDLSGAQSLRAPFAADGDI